MKRKSEYPHIQRFKILLDVEKISQSDLAVDLGTSRQAISKMMTDGGKPSFNMLVKIKERFPDLDLNWLITGNGVDYEELKLKIKKLPIKEPDPDFIDKWEMERKLLRKDLEMAKRDVEHYKQLAEERAQMIELLRG